MRKLTLLLLLLGALLLNAGSVLGQIAKFKAAYTYNICRFVEWPKQERSGDFVVGVLGNKGVSTAIADLAKKKKIFGRKIVVKYFSSVAAASKCHVLYIANSQTKRLPEVVVKIGKNPTLLVAEKEGAIRKGAAINFVLQGKKLRFEIKKVNATRQNLKINSSINKLALKVY